jgi:hypothetical protein
MGVHYLAKALNDRKQQVQSLDWWQAEAVVMRCESGRSSARSGGSWAKISYRYVVKEQPFFSDLRGPNKNAFLFGVCVGGIMILGGLWFFVSAALSIWRLSRKQPQLAEPSPSESKSGASIPSKIIPDNVQR